MAKTFTSRMLLWCIFDFYFVNHLKNVCHAICQSKQCPCYPRQKLHRAAETGRASLGAGSSGSGTLPQPLLRPVARCVPTAGGWMTLVDNACFVSPC